jgi:serine/threonine protein kinase
MMPELPGRIGRYEIDHRIGAGGMALTYRCRLEGIGGFSKRVVVKILHPDHVGDEAYVQMFLDEARLSARMHHENVAAVFEVGDDHGIPYMVMEHIDGPNLATVTRNIGLQGERPYGHIAHLFAGVCRGLAHAHGLKDDEGKPLGIVHRDVSLGNIVVSRRGVGKVIDFGIAKFADKRNVTQVGLLKGKLHYMAPEQLEGEVDHRADLYQVGVCLYWLCTGRPPFHDDDPARLWKARLEGEVIPPSRFIQGFPPELEEVILTCLATRPEDRWQTGEELADMLEAFCYSHPRWASGPDDVARWIKQVVPMTEDDEPSQRMRTSTSQARRSLGELMNAPSALPAAEVTGHGEPTLRPEAAGSAARARVGLAAAAVLLALAIAAGFVLGRPEGGDADARVYLEEATRLADEGKPEEARAMLERAAAADPQDAQLVVAISRLSSRIGPAPAP